MTTEIQALREAEAIEMQILQAGDTEGAAALRSLIDDYLSDMRRGGQVIVTKPTAAAAASVLAALFAA